MQKITGHKKGYTTAGVISFYALFMIEKIRQKEKKMKQNRKSSVKKMVMAAMLACLSYVCSTFVFFPRMAPFQHMFNVLGAVFVGPWWGLACAAVTGLMRMALNGRTIQALIGAIVGAFLAGIFYEKTGKIWAAVVGEVVGTGIFGALLVYPFMVQFYGLPARTPFWTFIPSYVPSSLMGAMIAWILLKTFDRTGLLRQIREAVGDERAKIRKERDQ